MQYGGMSTNTSPTHRVSSPCFLAASLTRKLRILFSTGKRPRVSKSATISTAQIAPSLRTSPTFGCSQKRCARSASFSPRDLHMRHRMHRFEQPQTRQRCGAPELISAVAVAVKESAPFRMLAVERCKYCITRDRRSKREISARDPFSQRENIRLHSLMLARENGTRSAEASHHFIEHQPHAPFAA